MDLAGVVEALLNRRFDDVLGLKECGWLDVKSGIYALDDLAKADELAKDVAGFANAASGGLLIVGISTRVEHGQEVLDQVKPVPRAHVDLDRHRKIIRERITPPPRSVDVDWIPVDDKSGLLLIQVPPQLSGRLPHIVPAPARGAIKSHSASFAIPVREADSTQWLPKEEVQRLLAAGWTAQGGPSRETLASIAEQAASAAVLGSQPVTAPPAPGEGRPSAQPRWAAAYQALGGQDVLGVGIAQVYEEGPGLVQHFTGTNTSGGWALCELRGRPVTAVAQSVWDAVQQEGSGAPGGDAFSALGFPDPGEPGTETALLLVDGTDDEVQLTGGAWGPGVLRRKEVGAAWRWEPQIRFSPETTRAGRNWTYGGAQRPELRMRVVATLPWARPDALEVPQAQRQQLLADLPRSRFSQFASVLARHLGDFNIWEPQWSTGQVTGNRRTFSYAAALTGPDGQLQLSAEVFLALPNASDSSVVTCAELRLALPGVWERPVGEDGRPVGRDRLAPEDLSEFTSVALEMATEGLPAALSSGTSTRRWSGVPTAEIRLTSEPFGNEGPWELDNFVDFTGFGDRRGSGLTEMSVTIIAPPVLERGARRAVARRALIRMGHDFGYLGANESAF